MNAFFDSLSSEDRRWMEHIARTLTAKGFLCYVVGGSVRDALLGVTLSDLDFASNAKPNQIAEIFPRAIPSGLKYGTMTLVFGKSSYQITTFRREVAYHADSRHPCILEFAVDLATDLQRRDFTINALVYDPIDHKIIDLFATGVPDLENQQIRCIGEPMERFQEDPLRIIRACRLAAKLKFQIVEPTWQAMQDVVRSGGLEKLSRERVMQELKKGLNPKMIDLLLASGVFAIFFPNLKGLLADLQSLSNQKDARLADLQSLSDKKDARLADLQSLSNQKDARQKRQADLSNGGARHPLAFLARLYFLTPGATTKHLLADCRLVTFSKQDLKFLAAYSYYFALQTSSKRVPAEARKFLSILKKDLGDSKQLQLFFAGLEDDASQAYSIKWLQERLSQDALVVTDLKIDGNDLLAWGVPPREIGTMLSQLLVRVWQDQQKNDRTVLEQWVRERESDK